MLTYREKQQNLIYEATGTRDVFNLPLNRFEDKSHINFDKIKGSVRLVNGKVKTEPETKVYIDKVLNMKLP